MKGLLWWQNIILILFIGKRQFPILSELARRFLIIPTTSVPSERLFSDAGNNMTNKRTTISPKIFKECIFLKRNNCIINSFKLIFILIKIIIIIIIYKCF